MITLNKERQFVSVEPHWEKHSVIVMRVGDNIVVRSDGYEHESETIPIAEFLDTLGITGKESQ